MNAPRAAPSLKGRALRLLARREHSRPELERRLAPHAESPEALAGALDELQARGFISEARVVDAVLHQRAAQYGALRLRQELQHKGVAPDAIAAAVAGLAGSEFERALALWRRRFRPAADTRERARQGRFLLARGFSAEVVGRVLKAGGQEERGG
ncbi:recombination regulator RecX [Pseudorhodoferax sp.]|uniref:recombination regulator RecX n=1 Tax=Pseudorhodoferax sp. TaxID=1993553 RepID=UPI0039E65CEB